MSAFDHLPPSSVEYHDVLELSKKMRQSTAFVQKKVIGMLQPVSTGLRELNLEIFKLIKHRLSWNLNDNNLSFKTKGTNITKPLVC